MYVSGNARTGKLMLKEQTRISTMPSLIKRNEKGVRQRSLLLHGG
jgi:hypothetical protein